MNKLAGISYIEQLGLPASKIFILSEEIEKSVREIYYPSDRGWAIRCGQMPDFNAKRETHLPWDVADTLEDLTRKIYILKKRINSSYLVFIHPQRKLEKIGNMLILPSEVIVEGIYGGNFDLLTKFMVRGCNPDETLVYSAGMLKLNRRTGENLFLLDELLQLRNVERTLVSNPNFSTLVEFSISDGLLDIHDLNTR